MRYRSSSRTIEPLDDWLDNHKLCRKAVAKDASCLFRAVAEYVLGDQSRHLEIRALCVTFMKHNREAVIPYIKKPIEEHILQLQDPNFPGDLPELFVFAQIYKADIIVYQENRSSDQNLSGGNSFIAPVVATCKPQHEPFMTITLCLTNQHQYDIVYTKDEYSVKGYSQSIVYNILYSATGMKNASEASLSMLLECSDGKNDSNASGESHAGLVNVFHRLGLTEKDDKTPSSNENSGEEQPLDPDDAGDLLGNNILPFCFKAAKCLDQNTYRNIEYDSWSSERRELNSRQSSVDELKAGDKVHIKLSLVPDRKELEVLREKHLKNHSKGNAKPVNNGTNEVEPDEVCYNGIIQSIGESGSPVNVYIEEIASKLVEKKWICVGLELTKLKKKKNQKYKKNFKSMRSVRPKAKMIKKRKKMDVPLEALEACHPSPTRSPYHRSPSLSSPSKYNNSSFKQANFYNNDNYGNRRKGGRQNSNSMGGGRMMSHQMNHQGFNGPPMHLIRGPRGPPNQPMGGMKPSSSYKFRGGPGPMPPPMRGLSPHQYVPRQGYHHPGSEGNSNDSATQNLNASGGSGCVVGSSPQSVPIHHIIPPILSNQYYPIPPYPPGYYEQASPVMVSQANDVIGTYCLPPLPPKANPNGGQFIFCSSSPQQSVQYNVPPPYGGEACYDEGHVMTTQAAEGIITFVPRCGEVSYTNIPYFEPYYGAPYDSSRNPVHYFPQASLDSQGMDRTLTDASMMTSSVGEMSQTYCPLYPYSTSMGTSGEPVDTPKTVENAPQLDEKSGDELQLSTVEGDKASEVGAVFTEDDSSPRDSLVTASFRNMEENYWQAAEFNEEVESEPPKENYAVEDSDPISADNGHPPMFADGYSQPITYQEGPAHETDEGRDSPNGSQYGGQKASARSNYKKSYYRGRNGKNGGSHNFSDSFAKNRKGFHEYVSKFNERRRRSNSYQWQPEKTGRHRYDKKIFDTRQNTEENIAGLNPDEGHRADVYGRDSEYAKKRDGNTDAVIRNRGCSVESGNTPNYWQSVEKMEDGAKGPDTARTASPEAGTASPEGSVSSKSKGQDLRTERSAADEGSSQPKTAEGNGPKEERRHYNRHEYNGRNNYNNDNFHHLEGGGGYNNYYTQPFYPPPPYRQNNVGYRNNMAHKNQMNNNSGPSLPPRGPHGMLRPPRGAMGGPNFSRGGPPFYNNDHHGNSNMNNYHNSSHPGNNRGGLPPRMSRGGNRSRDSSLNRRGNNRGRSNSRGRANNSNGYNGSNRPNHMAPPSQEPPSEAMAKIKPSETNGAPPALNTLPPPSGDASTNELNRIKPATESDIRSTEPVHSVASSASSACGDSTATNAGSVTSSRSSSTKTIASNNSVLYHRNNTNSSSVSNYRNNYHNPVKNHVAASHPGYIYPPYNYITALQGLVRSHYEGDPLVTIQNRKDFAPGTVTNVPYHSQPGAFTTFTMPVVPGGAIPPALMHGLSPEFSPQANAPIGGMMPLQRPQYYPGHIPSVASNVPMQPSAPPQMYYPQVKPTGYTSEGGVPEGTVYFNPVPHQASAPVEPNTVNVPGQHMIPLHSYPNMQGVAYAPAPHGAPHGAQWVPNNAPHLVSLPLPGPHGGAPQQFAMFPQASYESPTNPPQSSGLPTASPHYASPHSGGAAIYPHPAGTPYTMASPPQFYQH